MYKEVIIDTIQELETECKFKRKEAHLMGSIQFDDWDRRSRALAITRKVLTNIENDDIRKLSGEEKEDWVS